MVAELELFLRQYLLFFHFVLQRKNGPPSALYTDTSVTLRSYIIWNGTKNRPEVKCGRWTKLLSIAFLLCFTLGLFFSKSMQFVSQCCFRCYNCLFFINVISSFPMKMMYLTEILCIILDTKM